MQFLYVWTSLIMRAIQLVPTMASNLIAFQFWFSKIGFQMALSWEQVSSLIVSAVNLIGTGSGSFANPGLEAERAVRALASGSIFNAPNLGCENFQAYAYDYHLSSGDAYGHAVGTAINCTSDSVYCSHEFR